jgi:lipoprotein-anchoring transpeptidase ErfK/SrfK
VAPGSTLRLQQLLAQLGYLPVSFTPATQPTSPQDEADAQQGTFSWRWANQPASLTSLWNAGQDNEITKGAIMSFESLHGLKTDGLAGPQVWTDLLQAAATGANDPQAYGYVYVSQNLPETTTVYQNGSVAYSTLANTGVPGASTAPGTFTVYSRFRVTTMSGTNPDGSKYSDPGIPWVSYFNGGDALHGFVRAHYGFPQSDGCVEMPPANAEVVWPMTPIGTLVTVS